MPSNPLIFCCPLLLPPLIFPSIRVFFQWVSSLHWVAGVLEWDAIAFSDDQPRQHVKKQRHYFANKGLVKAMVFPVVRYGCESWTIKKAGHWRIDAFELWYWKRCLRVSWTARRSNQSILKEISPEYSLEGLMLNLKLQYFGHLMWITDSLEKTLMLGKIEGGRRKDDRRWYGWMASPTQWTWVWVNSGNWWWTGRPGVLQSMGSQRVGHDWATKLSQLFWRKNKCL